MAAQDQPPKESAKARMLAELRAQLNWVENERAHHDKEGSKIDGKEEMLRHLITRLESGQTNLT